MKLVQCSRCGSKELHEEGGLIVCDYCQSQFVPQADETRPADTVVGVHSDIENLLEKCRTDPANRRRYASLILDLDPTNTEAVNYLYSK